MNIEKLKKQLKFDEGIRKFPYRDSVGKLTIGVGRNLDDRGLSEAEIEYLLNNDIEDVQAELICFEWYNKLSDNRQSVITNMAFNMGVPRLMGFKKMITAIENDDYDTAAIEMLDSKWAAQVGRRAHRLSEYMRDDK